jgi:hypothetical protein
VLASEIEPLDEENPKRVTYLAGALVTGQHGTKGTVPAHAYVDSSQSNEFPFASSQAVRSALGSWGKGGSYAPKTEPIEWGFKRKVKG